CRRCGRKPGDVLPGDFSLLTDGALAAQPRPVAYASAVPPEARRSAADLSRAVQRPLFQEKPAGNVIAFEVYAPPRPEPRARKAEPAKNTAKPVRKPAPRVAEAQGKLDFLPAMSAQP